MTFYLYIKAFHIIAVISWMAGMLYLPRLFVYHSNKNNTKEMNETFVQMEKRLFNYIMRPAMAATWVLGLILVFSSIGVYELTSVWFIAKLICVFVMTGLHEYFGLCRKALIKDNAKSILQSGSDKLSNKLGSLPDCIALTVFSSNSAYK